MTTDREGTDPSRHRDSVAARIRRLVDTAAALGGEDELRRDDLVERAEAKGLDRPTAEQAYDIAREVALKPAWGLAAVLEGISVRLLPGPRPDVGSSEPNEPEWLDAPPDPALAERERRLRQTFRRLRARFEESAGADAVVDALCDEPDLEAYDYRG